MNLDINFDLYVKTSAKGKTGIHWRHIENAENQPLVDTPNLINIKLWETENKQKFFVNDLIDEYKPSLLLLRKDNKILLEVSGIESPKRSEQLGRKVLNLIVWIFDDTPENDQLVRMIADSAIQCFLNQDSSFKQMIETAVDFHLLEEFRVNREVINQFIENLQTNYQQIFSDHPEINHQYLIAAKSDKYLSELSAELRKSQLPATWNSYNGEKKDGVLIVVTDYLNESTILHHVGVWIGFATNVKEPVKLKAEEKKTETPAPNKPEKPQTNKNKNPLIILLIVVIIVIIVIMFNTNLVPKMQPTPEPTLQETVPPQTQSGEKE